MFSEDTASRVFIIATILQSFVKTMSRAYRASNLHSSKHCVEWVHFALYGLINVTSLYEEVKGAQN